jgi:hypothetical protein
MDQWSVKKRTDSHGCSQNFRDQAFIGILAAEMAGHHCPTGDQMSRDKTNDRFLDSSVRATRREAIDECGRSIHRPLRLGCGEAPLAAHEADSLTLSTFKGLTARTQEME